MKAILERLTFDDNELKGIALIPAPTGFGKTYLICDFIAENIERIIEQKIKIIFVTPLLKNLPVDVLQEAFHRHQKSHLFDECFLRLPSRLESFSKHFESVEKQIPTELKKSAFKQIKNILMLSAQTNFNSNPNLELSWLKFNGLDKSFRSIERGFRNDIKNMFFTEKGTKSAKRKILNQPQNEWVFKLYPEANFDEKPIVMMSMTKFLMPLSTLIDSAKPTVEKLNSNTLVIMDEVDSCKQDIQNVIIESGLDHAYDPLHLIKTTRKHLKTHNHSRFFLQDSEQRQKKMAEKGWQPLKRTLEYLMERLDEVYERFNLDMQLKSKDVVSSRHFLFHDYQTMQLANKITNISVDKQEAVNWIKTHTGLEAPSYRLDALVSALQSTAKMLKRSIANSAQNYLENKNKDGDTAVDEMMREQSLNTVMSEYAIDEKSGFRQSFFDARLQYKTNIRFKSPLHENYYGFCEQGFNVFALKDSPEHDTYTAIEHYSFTDTPENYLNYLCDKARVIGLSATAEFENPIGNFHLDYLRDKLGDNFIPLTEVEHARVQAEFEKRIKGYSQIKIDVKALQNTSDFEQALLDLLQDDIMVEQIYDEINLTRSDKNDSSNQSYKLQRYINLFTCFKQFIENTDIYGYMALFSALPREDNIVFSLDIINRVFNHLTEGNDELTFKVLQSKNYENDLAQVMDLLSQGNRVFVISTYQTLGAGQNLQFPIPETLKNTVIKINDFDASECMDFNGLYLDDVTGVMASPRGSDDYTLQQAIDRIFKIEYLMEAGDISNNQKIELIKHSLNSLNSNVCSSPKGSLKETLSYRNAVAAKLIQAIGRLCRTNQKASRIVIRLREDMLNVLLNADLPKTTPLLPEVKAILDLGQSTFDVPSLEMQKITKSQSRNEKSANNISRMLNNITSPNHIKSWRQLRLLCLANPCFNQKPAHYLPDMYCQLPGLQQNYWYKSNDVKTVNVKISNSYQPSFKSTDTLTQALNQLMLLDGLKDCFEKNGWATQHQKSEFWLVPAMWQNIYQGALGEEIGRFIFEKILGYPLYELPNEYYEMFDFKLKEGVYIDFKLWLNYGVDSLAYRVKLAEKIERIGAKKILAINIYGSKELQPVNVNTDVIEIPGLVINGKLNNEALKIINEVYHEE